MLNVVSVSGDPVLENRMVAGEGMWVDSGEDIGWLMPTVGVMVPAVGLFIGFLLPMGRCRHGCSG